MNKKDLEMGLSELRAKALKKTVPIVWSLALLVAGALGTIENTADAEATYKVESWAIVQERQPWMLTESGDSQKMPEVKWKTSHDRFKELCEAYGLPAGLIREVENRNNIREWVILAIIIAETSWGKFGYWVEGCHNIWNVGNNDRGDRVCYDSFETGLEKIAQTLNNSLLWTTQTLGCLSRAGSCKWREDKGYIYASSDGNWERNMLNVLNTIYREELWEINPERFNVRRAFTIYQ